MDTRPPVSTMPGMAHDNEQRRWAIFPADAQVFTLDANDRVYRACGHTRDENTGSLQIDFPSACWLLAGSFTSLFTPASPFTYQQIPDVLNAVTGLQADHDVDAVFATMATTPSASELATTSAYTRAAAEFAHEVFTYLTTSGLPAAIADIPASVVTAFATWQRALLAQRIAYSDPDAPRIHPADTVMLVSLLRSLAARTDWPYGREREAFLTMAAAFYSEEFKLPAADLGQPDVLYAKVNAVLDGRELSTLGAAFEPAVSALTPFTHFATSTGQVAATSYAVLSTDFSKDGDHGAQAFAMLDSTLLAWHNSLSGTRQAALDNLDDTLA